MAYRDHCVWQENGRWSQLIGAGIRGQGGTALLYTSPDLHEWTYEGPILVGDARSTDPLYTGTMWECVDLIRGLGSPPGKHSSLGDKHVLLFSVMDDGTTNYSAYYTGHYADGRFTPEYLGMLDYGQRYFYAPQSMREESGRRTMFGWLMEDRPKEDVLAAGWAGVMSLPRRVELAPDGSLLQSPVDNVELLRDAHVSVEPLELQPGKPTRLPRVEGEQLDIEVTLVLEAQARVEFAVRCTPDGSERTVVVLDRGAGELRLGGLYGPLPIGPDGLVELRVLVDHSALEVFANGRALTARTYPARPDATGVEVRASNAPARLARLDAWTMTGIWDGPRQARPNPATGSK